MMLKMWEKMYVYRMLSARLSVIIMFQVVRMRKCRHDNKTRVHYHRRNIICVVLFAGKLLLFCGCITHPCMYVYIYTRPFQLFYADVFIT